MGFDKRSKRRISRTVVDAESRLRNLPPTRRPRFPGDKEAIVRITSNTPDGDGYYPGIIQTLDDDGEWVDGEPCLVKDLTA